MLGSGNSSLVDSVECQLEGPLTEKVLARKVFRLNAGQTARDVEISKEVRIMNRLRHQHIVSIVLTYEEEVALSWGNRSYGILMEPVAEGSLEGFLEAANASGDTSMRPKLYEWYGCLASGLAFIHHSRVRHKDIKPSNVVIKDDDVLYVDFGLSRDFDEEVESTTTGYAGPKTPKYCAPEVAAEEPRGRPADMFSLGCVFSEMVTISLGDSRGRFSAFRGEEGARAFHLNLERSLRWLLHLIGKGSSAVSMYARPLARCFSMLQLDAQLRIDAASLAKMMRSSYEVMRPRDTANTLCDCLTKVEHKAQTEPYLHINVKPEVISRALDLEYPISWDLVNKSWIQSGGWSTIAESGPDQVSSLEQEVS